MDLVDRLDQFYSKQTINVIWDELRFCHKLGIGEKAYAGLRQRENLRNTVEALGIGAMASGAMASSVVATTFFSGSGWLAAVGLATAATPVGWVVGAGLAVGGGYLGIVKLLEQPKDKGLVVIPKHINTPLDLLASTLLDFYIPLGLKFSWLDDHACEKEQKAMLAYLTDEWGYSEAFLEQQLPLFTTFAKQVNIVDVVERYIDFAKNNPDCDLASMHKFTMAYLEAIVKADDVVTDQEQAALVVVNKLFINSSDTVKLKASILEAKKTLIHSAESTSDVFIGTTKKLASSVSGVGVIHKKGLEGVKSVFSAATDKASKMTGGILKPK